MKKVFFKSTSKCICNFFCLQIFSNEFDSKLTLKPLGWVFQYFFCKEHSKTFTRIDCLWPKFISLYFIFQPAPIRWLKNTTNDYVIYFQGKNMPVGGSKNDSNLKLNQFLDCTEQAVIFTFFLTSFKCWVDHQWRYFYA